MGCQRVHDPKVDLKQEAGQEVAKLLYMQATMGLPSNSAQLSLSEFGVGKKDSGILPVKRSRYNFGLLKRICVCVCVCRTDEMGKIHSDDLRNLYLSANIVNEIQRGMRLVRIVVNMG
jgi:hypothetical protein